MLTWAWCKQMHADMSSYSSFCRLAGRNKVGWNNKLHCLHVGPGYRSVGTHTIKYPRANRILCVCVALRSGKRLLSWKNSPFCIHPSTHLQQTSSSQLLILFMSLVFLSAWTAPTSLLSEPARSAPHYFAGLPITNHLQSAIKRILLKINESGRL